MKGYFAYIRVSTQRQGEQGVSLQEQRAEIERYATQKGLEISEWLEERETAVKSGRRVFTQMLKRLRKREAKGVIIHKIDRSARNLRDWADIAELSDAGIQVHFTRESLDMNSSSGRLAADVQAVVAANYVRNLREETIKGFYGRLKQGILPMPAPLGYMNTGPGKPKTIDPVRGQLIAEAFRLYASGRFTLRALCAEMKNRGLTSKSGRPVSLNTLNDLLRNPFYCGLIRIRKGNQSFLGAHQPLTSHGIFQQVQDVMSGRRARPNSKPGRRAYRFSRLVRCKSCDRSLIAEEQKGHVYYRCHTRSCPKTAFREEMIEAVVQGTVAPLQMDPDETAILDEFATDMRANENQIRKARLSALDLRLSSVKDRLNRLTDVYIDGQIDSAMFNQRKEALLTERLEIEQEISELNRDHSAALTKMEKYVELAKCAYFLYKDGNEADKREFLEMAMSNRTADEKSLDFSLKSELSELVSRPRVRTGGPSRRRCRTFWRRWIDQLCEGAGSTEYPKAA